jgi:hypothetical protein
MFCAMNVNMKLGPEFSYQLFLTELQQQHQPNEKIPPKQGQRRVDVRSYASEKAASLGPGLKKQPSTHDHARTTIYRYDF